MHARASKSTQMEPDVVYAAEWVDWGDFLGSLLDYGAARAQVKGLQIRSEEEWLAKVEENAGQPLIERVPTRPDKVPSYRSQWVGWAHWLGLE